MSIATIRFNPYTSTVLYAIVDNAHYPSGHDESKYAININTELVTTFSKDNYAIVFEFDGVERTAAISGGQVVTVPAREHSVIEAIHHMVQNSMVMWHDPSEPPPEKVVVIIEYSGYWKGRGNGGVTDAHMYDGKWFNIPPNITVTRWAHIDGNSQYQRISGA